MKKLTKRKAFNFMRSYFDVLNELENDPDKLEFLMAIINKQFLDEDPEGLSYIVKLCYEGQRHTIERSVKGYKDKTKQDLLGNPIEHPTQGPWQGGRQGGRQGPWQQEEEEEKEKEEEEEEFKRHQQFLKNEDLKMKAMDDTEWMQVMQIKFSCGEDKIKSDLDVFQQHREAIGKTHGMIQDFKAHFNNWMNKKPISRKTKFRI